MENQVYLLSLNRAGADYGGSVFCPPWLDDDHPPQFFRLTSKPLSAWSLILIY
jgi:nitrilase